MNNNTKTVTVKYVVGKAASGKTTKLIRILVDKSKNGNKNIFVSNEIQLDSIIKKMTEACMLQNIHNVPMNVKLLTSTYELLKSIKEEPDYLKDVKNIFIDGSWTIKKKDFVQLIEKFNGTIYQDYQLPRYCK